MITAKTKQIPINVNAIIFIFLLENRLLFPSILADNPLSIELFSFSEFVEIYVIAILFD